MHSALVWGSSVKHNPQKVGKEHVLNDEDVVQIVKKLVNTLSQYKSCMGVCMVVHTLPHWIMCAVLFKYIWLSGNIS